MELVIRPCEEADLQRIAEIYFHFVSTSTCTWAEPEESSVASLLESLRQKRDAALLRRLPWLVACDPALQGPVIGYVTVNEFRARRGWRFTCEHAIYVEERYARRGVGRRLLTAALAQCRASRQVANLIAVISVEA
jgi:L-amino acid N-acyltransferase YncA